MGTIYIDLLVIINLYITFFLLKGTAVFLHRKAATHRILLGSLAGGVSSLVILLPTLPFLLNSACKIVTGLLIVLITFGYKKSYEYLKTSLIFIVINVVFAGLALLLWFFVAPSVMEYNNAVVYLDISLPVLVITTALAYGVIRFLRYMLDAREIGEREHKVIIKVKGKSVVLDGLADSGNVLIDYFSGLPVIVCPYSPLAEVAPDGILDTPPPVGIRLLPYNTIDSHGLIPVFKADEVIINDKTVNVFIGIITNSREIAIFNPKLLI